MTHISLTMRQTVDLLREEVKLRKAYDQASAVAKVKPRLANGVRGWSHKGSL